MSDQPEDTVHVATLARNGSTGVSTSKALTAADLVDQCLYLPVGVGITDIGQS